MSAPLRLVPGEGEALPALPRPRRRPSWAHDPLDELAERLAPQCATAVHPDEIAALLESDGLTDDQITARYGRRDLFEIARELYARVPRAFPEPAPQPDPWRADPWRCALRGLVFALPALAYVLGERLLAGPPEALGLPAGTRALASAALAGWAWHQALAHRAYVLLAVAGRRRAARCLLAGAPAGALVAAGTALVAAGPTAATCFAAGQALYLSAATVLLVLGRERLLLAALTPLVAGVALLLAAPAVRGPLIGALPATAAATLALAARELRRARRDGPGTEAAAPALAASLPYGLFGLAGGVLTLLAGLGSVVRYGAAAPVTGACVAALTLSMGGAEWLLHRYRSRAAAALRRSTTAGEFRVRAGRALGLCLLAYLALVAVLTRLAAEVWPAAPLPGTLALAAALWTALLLQATGTAWPAAACCLAAAAAESALLLGRITTPALAASLACGLAAATLLATAVLLLGRVTAHR